MSNLPMEVKTILAKIRQKEEESSEYYFALELGLEFVKSAIFSIENNQVKVLSQGSLERWQDEEELVEAVDASLSAAAEKLPVEGEIKEPEKVVFGLPFSWIEGEKIATEKLKLLKNISDKLDLKPTGFVVITEAIVHHLKSTEGVPPTVILVHLGLKKISVGVVRVGKIFGPKLIERSESLAHDLIEGLSRFEISEPLPARILIYNSQEGLEEARQQLVGHPWLEEKKEKVEFLHLPKVEVLPANFDVEAIALAGGKEVAKAAGLILEEKPVPEEKEEVEEETEKKEEKVPVVPPPTAGFADAGELGFVKGDEAVEKESIGVKEEPSVKEAPQPEEPLPSEPPPMVATPEPAPQWPESEEKSSSGAKFGFLSRFLGWWSKINPIKLKAMLPRFSQTPSVLIIVALLVVVFLTSQLAAYWFLPRAEVTLYL